MSLLLLLLLLYSDSIQIGSGWNEKYKYARINVLKFERQQRFIFIGLRGMTRFL